MRPSLRYRNQNFEHPLMQAAAASDLDRLKQQLDAGTDLSRINEHGSVPLVACVRGQQPERLEAMRSMIEHGASVNHTDAESNSPLHHACYLGDAVAARLLLEHGAELTHDNDDHLGPLAAAAASGHWPLAELLIDHGAELNPGHGIPPLHAAAMLGQDDRAGAETLIRCGAEVNFRGKLGRTALMGAAMKGNAKIAELLLKSGADINARDDFGNTALMEATRSGANAVLEQLVFWHPDTGYRDKPGRTALLVAVSSRRANAETVRLLLAMGADPHVRNREGREAGDLASAAGRWRIAKALGYEPVTGRRAEPGVPTAAPAPSRIESEDEAVVIDIAGFATKADTSWAKRQMRGRSRTQLQAASSAAPAARAEPPPRFELVPENLTVPATRPVPDPEPETAPVAPPAESERAVVPAEPEPTAEAAAPESPAVLASETGEVELDAVVDLEAAEPAAVEAGDEFAEPASPPDRQLGYQALIEAATGDDIDQMKLVMLSQDEVPEWWLAAAFLNSVAHGRLVAPRWLLDNGLSPNASGESGLPLLSTIVQQSPTPVDTVELLLDRGARVVPEGRHLLWISGYADHQHGAEEEVDPVLESQLAPMVPRLVDGGASPDARDSLGRAPLHWAVRHRGVDYLTALLDAGADPNAQDEGGDSVLMYAVQAKRSCQMGLIRALIKRGADPRRANDDGVSPMSRATQAGDDGVLKQLMLGAPGAQSTARSERHDSLVDAAADGNLGRVKRLLAGRVDVNERDQEGCTALLRAAGSGHSHVVTALLAAGGDPNLAARNGTTPLGAAVLAHNLEMARLLIERGVPVDQPQQFGITPLMLGAARWHPRMVRLLLKLGAEVDHRDEADGTALMAAAQNAMFSSHLRKGEDTLGVLLEAGADVNAVNDEGQSALMLLLGVRARETQPVDGEALGPLVRRLLDAGADLDAQDFTGWCALHTAAAHGFLEPTRALLAAGANKRLRDINGLSPCDLAMDHAHDRLVDLFLSA